MTVTNNVGQRSGRSARSVTVIRISRMRAGVFDGVVSFEVYQQQYRRCKTPVISDKIESASHTERTDPVSALSFSHPVQWIVVLPLPTLDTALLRWTRPRHRPKPPSTWASTRLLQEYVCNLCTPRLLPDLYELHTTISDARLLSGTSSPFYPRGCYRPR